MLIVAKVLIGPKKPELPQLMTGRQILGSPSVPVKSAADFLGEGVRDTSSEAVEGVAVAGLGGEVKIGLFNQLKAVHLHFVNCHRFKR